MRPTRDELLMRHALLVAERSTCSRLQVGCVISRDGRILVTGYNGAPAGMEHCNHDCDCRLTFGQMLDHAEFCASQKPCTMSVHAECNAIAFAARHGISVLGAEMTTTDSPCWSCSQLIINAGLNRVGYGREYRDTGGLSLLFRAGLQVDSLSLPA